MRISATIGSGLLWVGFLRARTSAVSPTLWELRTRTGGVAVPAGQAGAAQPFSPFFAPLIQPTLSTGTEAIVVAVMAYFGKRP